MTFETPCILVIFFTISAVSKRKQTRILWLCSQSEENRTVYTDQVRVFTRLLRQKKRGRINNLLNTVEKDKTARDIYRTIRFFKKGFTSKAYGIKKKQGK